jgi:hypothetical protein
MASIINTQLSPGVNVSEIDLTTVVPTLGTTTGAIAGIFNWGPVGERMLITNESALVNTFGKPTSRNAETWFTAANFLTYGNSLYVVRAGETQSTNTAVNVVSAVANIGTVSNVASQTILNPIDFENKAANTFDGNTAFVAKYAGSLGTSLKISICDSPNAYGSDIVLAANAYSTAPYYVDVNGSFTINISSNSTTVTVVSGSANALAANAYAGVLASQLTVGDYIIVGIQY